MKGAVLAGVIIAAAVIIGGIVWSLTIDDNNSLETGSDEDANEKVPVEPTGKHFDVQIRESIGVAAGP